MSVPHEQPAGEQAEVERSLLLERMQGYGKGLLRYAGCTAAAGVILYPLMNDVGLRFGSADTEIATFPAHLSYSGNGATSLTTGATGSAFINKTVNGVGINADITGITREDLSYLTSNTNVKILTNMYNDPDQAIDGYKDLLFADAKQKALLFEFGGALLLGGLAFSVTENIRRQRVIDGKEPLSNKALAGYWTGSVALASVAITAPLNTYMESNFEQQGQPLPAAGRAHAIPQLANTPLAEMYTDSAIVESIVTKVYPKYREYTQRGIQRGDAYVASGIEQLDDQTALIAQPKEDEIAIPLSSDEHFNWVMLRIMRHDLASVNDSYPDDKKMKFLLSFGDTGYSIKPAFIEEGFLKEFAQMLPDGEVIVAPGNHNDDETNGILAENGAIIADGQIIDKDGTKILGFKDPRLTPWLGKTTPDGAEGVEAEIDLGEKAREVADEEGAQIIMLHECAANAAFVDQPSSSAFLAEAASQDYTAPYEDGVPDVAASLEGCGHSHNTRTKPARVIWNSDGTWSVYLELGTSGGAIDSPTIGSASMPQEPPKDVASYMRVFQNTESGLITGYQRTVAYPDGRVVREPRVDIGSPDGLPFPVTPRNKYRQPSQDHIEVKAGNKKAAVKLKPGSSARSKELFDDMRRLSANHRR